MVGREPAGDGLGRRWIYQKRGRAREVGVRRDSTPEDPITPASQNRCEGQDMRVLKLPAWPVAETRVRRSRKGDRRGERMTTAGNRGGREGGGRIMRLGLSNQRRLRIAASKV